MPFDLDFVCFSKFLAVPAAGVQLKGNTKKTLKKRHEAT
jgi:hypothetical protein